MSLQGLMSGSNPLLIMAAALLYFLFLYLKRGGDSEHPDAHGRTHHGHTQDAAATSGHGSADTTRHHDASVAVSKGSAGTVATSARSHESGHRSEDASATAGYGHTEFTDDTLRRHNATMRYDRDGAGAGIAAAATAATAHSSHGAGHSSSTHHTAGASGASDGRTGAVSSSHVPEGYAYSERSSGGSWHFPVIAALCASLVSCQLASKDGIYGIPGNIAEMLGAGRAAAPVVAKIEAKVPDAAQIKAKVAEVKTKAADVVETAKTKVAEVKEKVIEAAAPAQPAPKPVAPAPAPAPVAPAAPEPAPVSLGGVGVTSYYGIAAKPDATFPWAAPATVFEVAAPAPAPAPAPAAPVAVAPAAPEPAPVSLGGVGVTSYYGIAEKPDATFPWAAAATVFKVAEPAPAPAPAPAPVAPAAPEPAPVSLGGVGVTSYYGIADRPDATFPWAAAATVYKVAAPAPAPKAPAPTPAAIENCRDALNAEAQAGKINFATSSFEILPDSFKTLDKLAKLAKDCGGVVIDVGGHTDSTGKAASNKTLSELRAKAVVRYLTGAGVDASKLKATGYGQDRPVADNGTEAGKRQNRRIEFLVSAP